MHLWQQPFVKDWCQIALGVGIVLIPIAHTALRLQGILQTTFFAIRRDSSLESLAFAISKLILVDCVPGNYIPILRYIEYRDTLHMLLNCNLFCFVLIVNDILWRACAWWRRIGLLLKASNMICNTSRASNWSNDQDVELVNTTVVDSQTLSLRLCNSQCPSS